MHLHGGPHNGNHLDLNISGGTDIRWKCDCHGATYVSTGGVADSLYYEIAESVPAAFEKAFTKKELN